MNLDALEIYLREIRHFPLLSFEEEKKLFNDFKLNNNTEAKDKDNKHTKHKSNNIIVFPFSIEL